MFLPLCMLGLPQMQQGCDPSYPNAIESSKSHVGFVWLKVFWNLGRFVKLVIRTSDKKCCTFLKSDARFLKRWCTFFFRKRDTFVKMGPQFPNKVMHVFFACPRLPPKKWCAVFHWSATQRSNAETKLTGDACQKKCLAILRFITGYRSRMFNKWLPTT